MEYIPLNKQGTEVTKEYLIKTISGDLSVDGTMSFSAMEYYSEYPST